VLTDLNLRALAIGVVTYVLAVIVVSEMLTLIANRSPSFLESDFFRSLFWIVGTVMLCVGGFLSGLLAGRRGILHGIVVALGGALLAALYFWLTFPGPADQTVLSGYLTTGVVLSGLAGGNGELIALKRRGREL
jgi:hypothetical protein